MTFSKSVFEGEPYSEPPKGINVWKTVSLQAIHFGYLPNITRFPVNIGNWAINASFSLKVFFLSSILAIFALFLLDLYLNSTKENWLNQLHSRCLNPNRFIFNTHDNSDNLLNSSLAAYFLLFSVSFWVLCQCVTNLINTNLILLDLRDVTTHALQHMLNTDRKPCWLKDEQYLNSFSKAQPGSLFRLVWEKGLDNPCILDKKVTSLYKFNKAKNLFAVFDILIMKSLSYYFCSMTNLLDIWIAPKAVIEYQETFYSRTEIHQCFFKKFTRMK